MSDLSDIRRQYTKGGLRSKDLTDNPLELFERWMIQSRDAELSDPTAMVLATVDANLQPFQRIVLLKHFNEDGFVFYTNLGSRKAHHIKDNSRVSLHFPWHPLDRQVHITGTATQLNPADVLRYFVTRPRESQISAWASHQSSRISTRQLLEAKFFELKKKFSDGEIPVPSFWGGYRVKHETVEFWQGGDNRLHDRFLYTRENRQEKWSVERLAP